MLDSPKSLFRAMFWSIGLNFAIRGGVEHRNLSRDNVTIRRDRSGKRFLQFTETVSKTYKGGLEHRIVQPHIARAYEQEDAVTRCPIKIYEKYLSKLSPKSPLSTFYFKPLVHKGETHDVWFSCQPVGHNFLSNVVRDIMSDAGIEGYYTNHSLRTTACSRDRKSVV